MFQRLLGIFQRFSEVFRDPLRGRFPSQRLSVGGILVRSLSTSPNSSEPSLQCPSPSLVKGKSLDSPEKGNVDKMSKKCRKNFRKMSKNCPEGLKTQISDIFWTIFCLFGR